MNSAREHKTPSFLQRPSLFLESISQDCRIALRQLLNAPGFTIAAIAMLALGIGVNAAVFTVMNAALFRGFHLVHKNERILYIHNERNGQYSGVSYPDFEDWRSQARSFDGMGAVADLKITLNDQSGLPQRYTATRITSNAFRLLGQQPIIGRDFEKTDTIPGAASVAILSYGFWERRFGRDPAIIGQPLQINGMPPTTVIGVMPAGFSFPQDQDMWIPLVPTGDFQRRDARSMWFAFGRLADGVTIENARTELELIGSRLATSYPRTNQDQVPRPHTFADFFIGPSATTMYGAMWAAVGFVLLIACANLANLLLARAIDRAREISVRMALGSGRWRIIRQLLVESTMISIVGGLFGWWIAKWAVRAYELATNPAVGEWNRNLLDYAVDYHVFAYVMGISICTGLLFSFAPALQFARLDLNAALKGASRSARGSRSGHRLSRLLVIGEMAFAVVLLTGAGVMIRSFLTMYAADTGAKVQELRTMLVRVSPRYPDRKGQIAFFERLRERLDAIPGVESATFGPLPAAAATPSRRPYETADALADDRNRPTIAMAVIGPDYFQTLGATVLLGREFNKFDATPETTAVIVNQAFATQRWPGQNAVGQRLRLFDGDVPGPWLSVVGVVANIVYDPGRQTITPFVYMPYGEGLNGWVLVRSRLPAGQLSNAFRHEISDLDRDVVIWLGPYNLADLLSGGRYGNIRNHSILFLIFAAIALVLASIGLYAVVAHSIRQRTQEIGIRMAVGATTRDILELVFKLGMLPLAVGLIVGLLTALAVNRVLSSELVRGVSPTDPLIFALACTVLVLSAALGCWIPARRAIRVDPMIALRQQ